MATPAPPAPPPDELQRALSLSESSERAERAGHERESAELAAAISNSLAAGEVVDDLTRALIAVSYTHLTLPTILLV